MKWRTQPKPLGCLLALALGGASACEDGLHLQGDAGTDEGGATAEDSVFRPDDVAAPDVREETDGASETDEASGGEDLGLDEAGPTCPMWVAPREPRPDDDGTRDRPWGGLAAALEGRGACDHLVLLAGGVTDRHAADVNVRLSSGQTLLLEGEPESAPPPRFDGRHESPVLAAVGEGTLVLRHLAFENGGGGGCLSAQVAELRLEDTQWSACRSGGSGGAVRSFADRLEVIGSVFADNRAEGDGGALVVDGPPARAAVVIDGCRFVRNQAVNGGAVALVVPTTESAIQSSRFSDNVAAGGGSAVWGYLGGRIVGNRFERNAGGVEGGAVAGQAGWYLSEIAQNVFVGNQTRNVGSSGTSCCDAAAALDLSVAYVTIRNNLFLRNRSLPDPVYRVSGVGALRVSTGAPRILNNTFADNESSAGVAHVSASNADLRNNVFVGPVGAAVANQAVPGGWAVTDFNAAWNVSEPAFGGSAPAGDGNLETDPAFVDPAADDYRLRSGSPCSDAGDPAEDQRDPDGSRNDIGAFGGSGGAWTPLGA